MKTKIRREGRGIFSNRNEKKQPNILKIMDTKLKNLYKNNNRDTNINKLSTSSCNIPEEESLMSYI